MIYVEILRTKTERMKNNQYGEINVWLEHSTEKFKRIIYLFLSATWGIILLEVYNLVLSFI